MPTIAMPSVSTKIVERCKHHPGKGDAEQRHCPGLAQQQAQRAEQRAPDRDCPGRDGPGREAIEVSELLRRELAHVRLEAHLRRGVVERADDIPQQ